VIPVNKVKARLKRRMSSVVTLFIAAAFVSFLLLRTDALAARIILKSGKEIECRIIEKTQDYVKVDFNGALIYYQLKYIKSISEEEPAAKDGSPAPVDNDIPESAGDSKSFFLAALNLAAEGKFSESADKFREGLKLAPGDYNLQEGLKMAEDAADGRVPADYAALVFRGTRSMAEKKYPEAMEVFKEAIKLNPQDANLYYYLGVSAYFSGDAKQAVDYLQKAAELNPSDPEIYFNLGVNQFSLGDYKNAVESLQKAEALNPEDGEISSLLGTAAYLSGDFPLARQKLNKAGEIFEKNGDKAKAEEIGAFLKRVPEAGDKT